MIFAENVFSAFQYRFFLEAFFILILLALILPLLGNRMSQRGETMLSDTLSHSSLAGIAIGLAVGSFSGQTDVLTLVFSVGTSLIASFLVLWMRNYLKDEKENALTILLSFALGLTGILTKYIKGNRIDSYFFGSLFTITPFQFWTLFGASIVVLLFEFFFYRTNLALLYSKDEMKADRLPTALYEVLDTFFLSSFIALASNVVGVLLIASFVSIPAATGRKLASSYKGSLLISAVFSLVTSLIGLFVSYAFDIHVGGCIVMVMTFAGLVILLSAYFAKRKKSSSGV